MTDKGWWNYNPDIPAQSMESSRFVWFKKAMFEKLCENGQTVYNTWTDGYAEDREGFIKYHRKLKGAKIINVSSSSNVPINGEEHGHYSSLAVFPHGLVEIETCGYGTPGTFRINISSIDKGFTDSILKELKKFLTNIPPEGDIKMLINSGNSGYDFASIGRVDQPIIKTNYTDTVISGYNHIVEEIGSSDPCGRFILLNGDPGTGKSFFIRAIVSTASAWFVFIPSTMVGSLSGPSLVSLILENSESREGMPIVLIIEDADSSLVDRDKSGENMNQISDLLNIGDGLLGELADIRIIATTNARIKHIDRAILRPGRLCRKIEFATLKLPRAKAIFTNLTGSEEGFDIGVTTLAEVYKMARDKGWKPPKPEAESGQYV